MAFDPLGVDLAVTTDLDPTFRLCFGQQNLGNALLRRLNADAGSLATINDDPNYGENLNAFVSLDINPGDLANINARVVAQLQQDERVQSLQAQVIAVADQD